MHTGGNGHGRSADPVRRRVRPEDIVGNSPAIRAIVDEVRRLSRSDSCVVITGETGVGKELAARAIHDGGGRSDGPFVAVNCAAIPRELLESEFFGSVRGAYTGATADKPGLFEQAHRGTLFLDEIADLDPGLQVKLLRALEDGEIRRVGGAAPLRVDVRILAATHRDLAARVRAGLFRQDLFYRLNVMKLHLPPLRERRDDIPLLADHFLRAFCLETGIDLKALSPFTRTLFALHDWPGNARELKNIVERLAQRSDGSAISVDQDTLMEFMGVGRAPPPSNGSATPDAGSPSDRALLDERIRLRLMLDGTQGNISRAAEWMGVSRGTLYRRMKKHGVRRRRERRHLN
jgi:transcriptional regulator with PAS, ATPase and Fis domain